VTKFHKYICLSWHTSTDPQWFKCNENLAWKHTDNPQTQIIRSANIKILQPTNKQTNKLCGFNPWVTIPTKQPPLASKVSVNFCGQRGCCVVSSAEPYGRNLGCSDWSSYFILQVAPQLYSCGWVDLVPGPLLLRTSGSAGNQTKISGSVARNSDH
jgi:hypothetical protein